MSTQVDERVVEMRFNNKQFEENVKTSLSTLDKLKKALKLEDAATGLEKLGDAAKKFDGSNMERSVEAVSNKFSALGTIAIGALLKIGNQAVVTGARLLKSLSVDQIMAGWNKYESKTTSVQTIMAATGKSIDEVNQSLNKLIWFTDETSYSLTDMTNNIGKFTSQGIDLETSVTAMQGISTWASLSGGTISEAARAMYNLSQALGVGAVKLQDWKSIENANMATKEFKEVALEAAVATGSLTKSVDASGNAIYTTAKTAKKVQVDFANFSSTLSEGWFDKDTLLTALKEYGSYADGVYELFSNYSGEVEKTTSDIISDLKALQGADDRTILSKGYTEDQIELVRKLSDQVGSIGQRSLAAAQEAKTFSEAIGSVKEAVSSGWAETFEIIFGNYQQAKGLWTDLSNQLYNIFAEGGNQRNELLREAFSVDGITEVHRAIEDTGITMTTFKAKLREVGEAAKPELSAMIAEAGSFEATLKDGWVTTDLLKEALREAARETTEFTDENAEAFARLLMRISDSNEELDTMIELMTKRSGGDLIIESIVNSVEAVDNVLSTIKDSWANTFSIGGDQLYGMATAINALTVKIRDFTASEETIDKLTRSFDGLFAVLDIFKTVIGTGFKYAWKAVGAILGDANLDVLSFTARIGDIIVKFRDWVKSADYVTRGLDGVIHAIEKGRAAIINWATSFSILDTIQNGMQKLDHITNGAITRISSYLRRSGRSFADFVKSTKGFNSISFDGALNALRAFRDRVANFDFSTIFDRTKLVFRNFISDVGLAFGSAESSIEGMVGQAKTALGGIVIAFAQMAGQVLEKAELLRDAIASRVNFGQIYAAAMGVGILVFLRKLTKTLASIKTPLGAFTGLISAASGAVKNFGLSLKSKARAEMIDAIGTAILKLAAALVVLAQVPGTDLFKASLYMGALAAGIAILSKSLSSTGDLLDVGKLAGVFLALGVSLTLLSTAIKQLKDLSLTEIGTSLLGLAGSMVILVAGVRAIGKLKIEKFPKGSFVAIASMAIGLKLVVSAMTDLAALDIGGLEGLPAFAGKVAVAIIALSVLAKASSKANFKGGFGALAMVLALHGLVKAINEIAELNIDLTYDTIMNFAKIFGALVILGTIGKRLGKAATPIGGAVVGVAIAMVGLAEAMKILSGIDPPSFKNAQNAMMGMLAALGAITIFTTAIMGMSKDGSGKFWNGKGAGKVGLMVVEMAAAMVLMAGSMALISAIPVVGLQRAVGVMAAMTLMIGALVAVYSLPKKFPEKFDYTESRKTIIAMIAGIGVMLAAVAALSIVAENSPEALMRATACMGLLMGAFTAMLAVSSIAKPSWKASIPLMAAVAGLAGIVYALSQIDSVDSLPNTEALALLLTSFAASLAIISKFANAEIGLKGLGGLAGTLAIMLGVTEVLALIVGQLSKIEPGDSLRNVLSLTILLEAFASATAIVGAVGKFLGIGSVFKGGLAFGLAVTILGGILVGLGALNDKVPAVKEFMNSGLGILRTIGQGLGEVIGGIIDGIRGERVSTLATFGEDLKTFMTNFSEFCDTANGIDKSSIESVKMVAEAVAVLAGADAAQQWGKLIPGQSTLASFSEEFETLGKNLCKFDDAVKDRDFENADAAATAAMKLAQVMSQMPKTGGEMDELLGTAKPEEFATGLEAIATGLVSFTEKIGDTKFDDIGPAIDAAGKLAEMARKIPNSGGLWGKFWGENEMSDFSSQFTSFASCLCNFARIIHESGQSFTDVGPAIDAAGKLAEMARTIPNTGGSWASFFGDNGLGNFSTELPIFAEGIVGFAEKIGSTKASFDISPAITAAKQIIDVAQTVPNFGGKWREFWGDNQLKDFGLQIKDFGEGIGNFAKAVSNKNMDNVSAAVTACSDLSTIIDNLPKVGKIDQIEQFTTGLSTIAVGIGDFSKSVLNADAVNIATAAKAVVDLSGVLFKANETGATKNGKNLKDNLKSLGQGIKEFATAADGVEFEGAEDAIEVGQTIATLAGSIPGIGQFQNYAKMYTLEDFGANVEAFGTALVKFSQAVSEEGAMNKAGLDQAIETAGSLVKLSGMLPEMHGLFDYFTGADHMDFSQFGAELSAFGAALVTFSEQSENVNAAGIDNMLDLVQRIIEMCGELPEMLTLWEELTTGKQDLNRFGKNLVEFGQDLGLFISYTSIAQAKTGELQSLSNIIGSLSDLAKVAKDFDPESFGQIGEALKKLADDAEGGNWKSITSAIQEIGTSIVARIPDVSGAMDQLVAEILRSVNGKVSLFGEAGNNIVSAFASGIADSDTSSIEIAFSSVLESMSYTTDGFYSKFVSSGKQVPRGLADGIRLEKDKAVAAAQELGEAISLSFSTTVQIHSPSKLFEKFGELIDTGLAYGIRDYAQYAEEAANNLGENVVDAFREKLEIEEFSKLTKDEVGKYIVKGIAEGITEDMSAEEAAAKKAENIVNAFKDIIDKYSWDFSGDEAEIELYKKMHPNASEAELNQMDADLLMKKWNGQTKLVLELQAKYVAMSKQLGEGSKEAQQAKAEYYKGLGELYDIGNEYNKKIGASMASEAEARKAYAEYMAQNKDALLEMGFTLEQIEQAAQKASGWDPDGTAFPDKLDVEGTINSIMEGLDDVQVEFVEVVKPVGNFTAQLEGTNTILDAVNGNLENFNDLLHAGIDFIKSYASGGEMTIDDRSESPRIRSKSSTEKKSAGPVIVPVFDYEDDWPIETQSASAVSIQASQIAASILDLEKSAARSDTEPASNVTNYSFTQNNYSPKALDQRTIYRNTNTQFASMKAGNHGSVKMGG